MIARLCFYWPHHWNRVDPERDLTYYYAAARRVQTGAPLYYVWKGFGPDTVTGGYLYPPPFAAAIAPLGKLSPLGFSRVWYLLIEFAFWVYAAALARLAIGRWSVRGLLVAGMILGAWPGGHLAMSMGQADPLIWALLGLALTTRFPGPALALATLAKIHTVWPLAALAIRSPRRITPTAIMVIVAGGLLGVAMCGLGSYVLWLQAVPPIVGQGTFVSSNYSISMAILRLLRWIGWWNYAGGPLAHGPRLFLAISAVAGPITVWWATRRSSSNIHCACVAVAAIAFSPLCWTMYLPLTLLPIAAWIGEHRPRKDT